MSGKKVNRLDKEIILGFLRNHRQLLEEKYGVEQIALFGSYARDEQDESSDIDLLIRLKLADFDARMDLKYFLQDHFDVPVDIGYFDSLRSHVRKAVEGDIIYAYA